MALIWALYHTAGGCHCAVWVGQSNWLIRTESEML